jgi:MinD-like ATPase involved in chromosome partitioning or flagellar assembly
VLIGFASGKGSPGATLAVANIGVALAAAHHSALAVDLDPAGGVLSAYLGGHPAHGLWPLVYAGASVCPQNLSEQVEILHGLPFVGGFPRAADSVGIDIPRIARAAAGLAEVVLVDVGRIPGPGAPVLSVCDRIVLVVAADPLGILAAEQVVLSLGVVLAQRCVALVTGSTTRAELGEVADLLHVGVIGGIPWVPTEIRRARYEQRPLTGKAKKAFRQAAATLVPTTKRPARSTKRRSVIADA